MIFIKGVRLIEVQNLRGSGKLKNNLELHGNLKKRKHHREVVAEVHEMNERKTEITEKTCIPFHKNNRRCSKFTSLLSSIIALGHKLLKRSKYLQYHGYQQQNRLFFQADTFYNSQMFYAQQNLVRSKERTEG